DNLFYAFFYAGHSHSSAPKMPGPCIQLSHQGASLARQNRRRFSPLWATCPFYARPTARSTLLRSKRTAFLQKVRRSLAPRSEGECLLHGNTFGIATA